MSENKCTLCPRCCNVVRPQENGEKMPGFCQMPAVCMISRAGKHFWEEPIISGERGSGTVFFTGCNLRCVFCQNYDISSERSGKAVTVERLREIYGELIASGVHNINLVTPDHYAGIIAESLEPALPVPVVWNSNGYESPSTLAMAAGKVQIYLPDLKYADDALALRYSSAHDYFETACRAIDIMYGQVGNFEFDSDGMLKKGVMIRHLILPGAVENSLKVIDYVAKRFAPGQVLFSLMRQYLPCGLVGNGNYPELDRKISDDEYQLVEDALFASGIEDGFVQDPEAASAEFIPVFDGSGV